MTDRSPSIYKSQAGKKPFPKRVLFIADSKATHIIHWAKLLIQRGAKVAYFSFDPMKSKEFEYFFFRPWLKSNYIKFIVNAPRGKKIIKQYKADIVHGDYLTNYGLLAALAKPQKLVVTVAGSDIFGEPKRPKYFYYSNRYVLQKANLVHSVAKHMTESILKYNIPKEKIITFPEGIDTSIFPVFSDKIMMREPIVVCTRAFRPVYDIPTLIRAVPIVIKKNPRVKFLFIGDGPNQKEMKKRTESLNVSDNVKFLGYLPWKELVKYLHKSAIYVSPSLSDGTSASLLQAMVSGSFPIVSDIPANTEWIKHGENGYVFPVGNSNKLANLILMAIDNPTLRENAGKLNSQLVMKNGIDQMIIDKLITAYGSLIKQHA